MANCAAALPATQTRIAMTSLGVDVSVTSNNPEVIEQILSLASLHATGETAEPPHPDDRTHGVGRVGHCPIVVSDISVVTSTIIPGGAVLHVNARSASRVKELQDLVRVRATRMPGYLSS